MMRVPRTVLPSLLLVALLLPAVSCKRPVDNVDIEALGPSGRPILFWRIEQGDERAIEVLLDAGADIEAKGFLGATPVVSAATADLWRTVLLLLARGANPRAADRNGLSLAWLAKTSRVNPNSPDGIALAEVRDILRAADAAEAVEPKEAAAMVRAGTWPPG